jgi:2'-5' RNA ligase
LSRIFLAADLDPRFLDEATELAETFRGEGLRVVARAAMHVTLRFFGQATDAQLEQLRAFTTALPPPAIVMTAKRLTGFPSERRAHVLVVSLEDEDPGGLGAIAREAEQEAARLGFESERRDYHPHLTLARSKRPADVRRLCETELSLPPASVVAITLYDSKTLPRGPEYTALARVERP